MHTQLINPRIIDLELAFWKQYLDAAQYVKAAWWSEYHNFFNNDCYIQEWLCHDSMVAKLFLRFSASFIDTSLASRFVPTDSGNYCFWIGWSNCWQINLKWYCSWTCQKIRTGEQHIHYTLYHVSVCIFMFDQHAHIATLVVISSIAWMHLDPGSMNFCPHTVQTYSQLWGVLLWTS